MCDAPAEIQLSKKLNGRYYELPEMIDHRLIGQSGRQTTLITGDILLFDSIEKAIRIIRETETLTIWDAVINQPDSDFEAVTMNVSITREYFLLMVRLISLSTCRRLRRIRWSDKIGLAFRVED